MRARWIIAAALSAAALAWIGAGLWPTPRLSPASDAPSSYWSGASGHADPSAPTEHATTRHSVDHGESPWNSLAASPGVESAQHPTALRGLLTSALDDDLKHVLVAQSLKAFPSCAPIEIARSLEALPACDFADDLGTILEAGEWRCCTAEFLHVWLTTTSENLRRALQSSIACSVTTADIVTLRTAYNTGDEAKRARVCDLVAEVSSPEAHEALSGWAAAADAAGDSAAHSACTEALDEIEEAQRSQANPDAH